MRDARERFAAARVARLATVSEAGKPHVVPVVFALVDDLLWSAVDQKRKSTRSLRRLANIRAHPQVSLLVDHYTDDWTALWWVRADGEATVVDASDAQARQGLAALTAKYEQYRTTVPQGPFVRVEVRHWAQWSAS